MGIEDIEEDDGPLEERRKKSPAIKLQTKNGPKKLKVKEDESPSAPAAKEDEWSEADGELAVDVYQTDDDIVIQSAIAGVKPEDLDITVERDTVTIRGERSNEITEKAKNYFHQECYWGAFSRQVILPEEINPAGAEASMKNNILTLRLPKTERQKVKKVQVKS